MKGYLIGGSHHCHGCKCRGCTKKRNKCHCKKTKKGKKKGKKKRKVTPKVKRTKGTKRIKRTRRRSRTRKKKRMIQRGGVPEPLDYYRKPRNAPRNLVNFYLKKQVARGGGGWGSDQMIEIDWDFHNGPEAQQWLVNYLGDTDRRNNFEGLSLNPGAKEQFLGKNQIPKDGKGIPILTVDDDSSSRKVKLTRALEDESVGNGHIYFQKGTVGFIADEVIPLSI